MEYKSIKQLKLLLTSKFVKNIFNSNNKRKYIRPEDYTMLHTYTEKQLNDDKNE